MVVGLHKESLGSFQSRSIRWILLLAVFIPGLLGLCSFNLYAQRSPFDPAWTNEAAQIREELTCFTDRSLYMSEDLIQFRAMVTLSGPGSSGPWSTVLYVELVSANGQSLAQGKYPIDNQLSFGEIRIPHDMLSGLYYLRFYTRWMRNRGPETFCYLPVRILNPQRTDLDQGASMDARNLVPAAEDRKKTLEFQEHASSYERGEHVSMELLFPGRQEPDSISGCVSVVPLGVEPSSSQYAVQGEREDFRVNFLPDRYGPSLSGSLQYPGGPDKGLPPAVIHFTLMSEVSGYLVCRSDSLGKFTVALPKRSGKLEIFVQPEGPENRAVEVRIDQDFDPRHILFPHSPFTLTDSEKRWAEIMARNLQLSRIYGLTVPPVNRSSGKKPKTFYGTPTRSVDLDDYVLLPTLREVLINLVPGVTPNARRGRTTLQIESENPSLALYESLVMVDQVPVLDMEQFMSLSPAKIRQIDVIEDVYVKGDLRYGGVINLISRDQDMAGIDLPEHSFFIDYMALQPPLEPQQDSALADDQLPDTRNTLFWNPNLALRKGSSREITFKAPEYPGNYVVLFRGHSKLGEAHVAETRFKVR